MRKRPKSFTIMSRNITPSNENDHQRKQKHNNNNNNRNKYSSSNKITSMYQKLCYILQEYFQIFVGIF